MIMDERKSTYFDWSAGCKLSSIYLDLNLKINSTVTSRASSLLHSSSMTALPLTGCYFNDVIPRLDASPRSRVLAWIVIVWSHLKLGLLIHSANLSSSCCFWMRLRWLVISLLIFFKSSSSPSSFVRASRSSSNYFLSWEMYVLPLIWLSYDWVGFISEADSRCSGISPTMSWASSFKLPSSA